MVYLPSCLLLSERKLVERREIKERGDVLLFPLAYSLLSKPSFNLNKPF
jgi:hypothetical protein